MGAGGPQKHSWMDASWRDFLRRSNLGTDGMGKFVAMAMNKTISTPRTRGAACLLRQSWTTPKTINYTKSI